MGSSKDNLLNRIFILEQYIRAESTCDGCDHEPKEGTVFPSYCQNCKRIHSDKYEGEGTMNEGLVMGEFNQYSLFERTGVKHEKI